MKGKYAARAANRTEAVDREATEAAYRRRILKLMEERDKAIAERDCARADGAKEARILRAQLAEGTSPRVEALTREVKRIREERDRLAADLKRARDQFAAFWRRTFDHFFDDHGMTNYDARDMAVRIVTGGEAAGIVDSGTEARLKDKFGPELVAALRAARGQSRGLR